MRPYYQDDFVTLYHGDCLTVLPTIRGGACITDPPYGCGVPYLGDYDDSRSDYWDWMRECVIAMRRAAPVVVFTHRVKALAQLTDWDWIAVWNKPGASGNRLGNSPVVPHWEPVFLYGIHSLGVKTEMAKDVLTFSPQSAGSAHGEIGRAKWVTGPAKHHPCPKPTSLYARLIQLFAPSSAVVIDPFAGSGTTLRAAKDLGRKVIGIEQSEAYCELIAQRLSQEILDFGDVA